MNLMEQLRTRLRYRRVDCEGDLFHHSLIIEKGAYFEGQSRRVEDPLSSNQVE